MSGIFDYLKWRGDIPMSQVPLCDADRLILSELCYIDYYADEPLPIDEFCKCALKKLSILRENEIKNGVLHHAKDEKLLKELIKTKRFSKLIIGNSEEKINKNTQEQFAAVTVIMPSGDIAVIYRGTDWSVVGWKEDLNMAFSPELPAQRSAVSYLERIASLYDGNISVFGHSKGGNLSVYAASMCSAEVQQRITDVTSLDGPGFPESFLESEGYKAVSPAITTYMPRSSIVAAFFCASGSFSVIKSRGAGLLSHIAYNWEIMGGGFVSTKRDITTGHISAALNKWIASLTAEERRQFINTIWSVVEKADASELSDLFNGRNTMAILNGYRNLDSDSKRMVKDTLDKLRELGKDYLRDMFWQYKK